MWTAVKFSKESSSWEIVNNSIVINAFEKQTTIPMEDIAYIKNHMRSGGNLVVFHKKGKSAPIRIWRNKIFAANDQFDQLIFKLKELGLEILLG